MKTRAAPPALQVLCASGLVGLYLLGVAGCGSDIRVAADNIEIAGGDNQMGPPGGVLSEPLTVRVVGPRVVDFLGRRQERQPVEGEPVTFLVEVPKKSADKPPADGDGDGELRVPGDLGAPLTEMVPYPTLLSTVRGRESADASSYIRLEVPTDAAGIARANVRLGSRNGDWRVQASIARRGEQVRFRVVSGVEKEIGDPESIVGAKVSVGLRLSALQNDKDPKSLKPVPDRRVLYQIVGTPPGAETSADLKEKDKQSRTDPDGLSEIEVTLGHKPGVYRVLAEVEPKQGEEPIRGIILEVVAMDWVLVAVQLATGVLVFVIGVRMLGGGFLLITSPYMHLPTGSWAQRRFLGYLGGLSAGAIFESASLVTSHLKNLANGGLLTATAALGLMLGANVGGTMLPQILSQDIDVLAAPLLVVGTFLILAPRRAGLAPWSWVFLGAGLTLVGWILLRESTELASLSKELKTAVLFGDLDGSIPFHVYAERFFAYFMLGSATAFVLRTSNLIVVIAMLLASSGIILPQTALPLILGANLGAAAMVFALSLRKRREARRLALANLAFQAYGCAGAIVLSLIHVQGASLLVWLVEALAPGKLISALPANVSQHIATAHTAYNLLAGACFLVFPRALLAVVDRVLPPRPAPSDVKPYLLDRNLIAVPALALRQATEEVIYLTEICRKTVAEAFDSFRYNDLDISEQVVRRVEVIAEIHREVSQYLVEVCENPLSRRDASRLEILQTGTSSLVRIGELAERLRDLSALKLEETVPPNPEIDRDMSEAYDLVLAQFANVLSLFRQSDAKTEENAVKMTERLAKFSSHIESQWRQRLEQSQSLPNPVAIYTQAAIHREAFSLLFRVAGHLAHIAQCMRILTPERF